MEITLNERTEQNVTVYFEKANAPIIRAMLPQNANTLKEALNDYRQTLLPGAASFGRTIYVDGRYVGDVWCYCIDQTEKPNAMVSYCVFEEDCWGKGIATDALGKFLEEIVPKYGLKSVGAFTYVHNFASVRVLEKNGFRLLEEFVEDGVLSGYYQWEAE